MENLIFNATIAKLEAQKLEALANLSVCFTNPPSNGDLFSEIEKHTKLLNEAESGINNLQINFATIEKENEE
jgi:hypothetical protein